jgi:hypothetical protein
VVSAYRPLETLVAGKGERQGFPVCSGYRRLSVSPSVSPVIKNGAIGCGLVRAQGLSKRGLQQSNSGWCNMVPGNVKFVVSPLQRVGRGFTFLTSHHWKTLIWRALRKMKNSEKLGVIAAILGHELGHFLCFAASVMDLCTARLLLPGVCGLFSPPRATSSGVGGPSRAVRKG